MFFAQFTFLMIFGHTICKGFGQQCMTEFIGQFTLFDVYHVHETRYFVYTSVSLILGSINRIASFWSFSSFFYKALLQHCAPYAKCITQVTVNLAKVQQPSSFRREEIFTTVYHT